MRLMMKVNRVTYQAFLLTDASFWTPKALAEHHETRSIWLDRWLHGMAEIQRPFGWGWLG